LRDQQNHALLDFHQAMFNYRHVSGGNLNDRAKITAIIESAGGDASQAFADVESGRTLGVVREEHTKYVNSHQVWGTPTFVVDDKAVFVRLLDHAHGDAAVAKRTIDRILDDIDWPILNEFKHTSIPM
jgi:2-hydroxychromene-2-carboxylate isomerase